MIALAFLILSFIFHFAQDETLDMTFSVAMEGVEENKASWVQLAADVFEEMTRMPSLQTVLRE